MGKDICVAIYFHGIIEKCTLISKGAIIDIITLDATTLELYTGIYFNKIYYESQLSSLASNSSVKCLLSDYFISIM